MSSGFPKPGSFEEFSCISANFNGGTCNITGLLCSCLDVFSLSMPLNCCLCFLVFPTKLYFSFVILSILVFAGLRFYWQYIKVSIWLTHRTFSCLEYSPNDTTSAEKLSFLVSKPYLIKSWGTHWARATSLRLQIQCVPAACSCTLAMSSLAISATSDYVVHFWEQWLLHFFLHQDHPARQTNKANCTPFWWSCGLVKISFIATATG